MCRGKEGAACIVYNYISGKWWKRFVTVGGCAAVCIVVTVLSPAAESISSRDKVGKVKSIIADNARWRDGMWSWWWGRARLVGEEEDASLIF